MSYDSALTVFSPDGHLFQVEYALEAVRKGTCAVGVRGKDVAVLGVEKKSALKLQDPRTVRKIVMLDGHICLAAAGLTADARVLIDKARVECQSHRLTVEDPVSVEYITRHIASIQQKYTQSGGVRPFGISTLIIGSKTVREFLEKHYKEDMSRDEAVKLTIKSLLEVVQTGAKNIEIAVMGEGAVVKHLDADEIEAITKIIEVENAAEAEKKSKKGPSSSSAAASSSS
ncbi:hypothetical protein BASA61_008466 [Batrachochytrium salamandrivorans]|nr:hypothetical protein BASA61_008466 [Batrachochytrium salamandrivorans]